MSYFTVSPLAFTLCKSLSLSVSSAFSFYSSLLKGPPNKDPMGVPVNMGAPFSKGAPVNMGAPLIEGAPLNKGAPVNVGAPLIEGALVNMGAPLDKGAPLNGALWGPPVLASY